MSGCRLSGGSTTDHESDQGRAAGIHEQEKKPSPTSKHLYKGGYFRVVYPRTARRSFGKQHETANLWKTLASVKKRDEEIRREGEQGFPKL